MIKKKFFFRSKFGDNICLILSRCLYSFIYASVECTSIILALDPVLLAMNFSEHSNESSEPNSGNLVKELKKTK